MNKQVTNEDVKRIQEEIDKEDAQRAAYGPACDRCGIRSFEHARVFDKRYCDNCLEMIGTGAWKAGGI